MELQLDEYEAALLLTLLGGDYHGLRDELAHTDDPDYRDALRDREARLLGLVGKVADAALADPPAARPRPDGAQRP